MSFLRADDAEWMRELPAIPKAPAAATTRCFARRGKVIRLDDLVVDNDKEKRQKEQKKKRRDESSESSDDDDDAATESQKKLAALIKKCSDELGDESSMRDAPKWGEQVFGAQDLPVSRLELESIQWLSLASRTSRRDQASEDDGEEFLLDLLTGQWMLPLFLHGKSSPALLPYIFDKMTYSSNTRIQQAACSLLCEYFRKHGGELDWHPDFVRVLRCYGYQDATPQASDPAGAIGPPTNFSYVLEFLAVLSRSSFLQKSEPENYIFILARCLLDRKLLPFFSSIQDCIALLVNYLTEDEWTFCLPRLAHSLARVSKELVNVLHVTRKLRGARKRIQQLRREISFELLSMTNNELERQPKQVIFALEGYDLKDSVDFVQLYYHMELVDMWLRYDPSFKSDEEAFSTWMSLLRGFSLRIFCGDYRTFANKVRNRAAFLVSIYSEKSSSTS
ncbi:uncharacterized protein LOC9654318 [Selaginella moellendorffii]|uniref:uncharacterized protein LOC9654318 n=1 Tax=Selaginella moellendorffii TaxID=88036 RepID=UPI000D1D0BF1|nr:uncharacterized protein LOC9654318 [Selaginella moellendorffii]|eukprot:XP_024543945.1 uncharacterized protein LOC9654318 [Selaginella moellendorffii]